ncbi:MAG TPA: diguanylate cyclase [Symbiobacteriaceae bacterium]|nr:diguanylate cyclase [Symbiobacteriaceae bacterium]
MQRKRLVLIVDDDPVLRRVLRWSLESLGYEVDEAADAAAALDAVRTLRPDAVLLDVIMPETGGLEVLAQIKHEPVLAETPVLFLTAAADMSTKAAGFELGAQDYILKSADLREVDLRLKTAIAAVRRREELVEQARKLTQERERLAGELLRDPLTGLLNRRALDGFAPGPGSMTLLMVDVDRFKRVNDRYGHPVGDRVLQAVARCLQEHLRDLDLCVRYGGEEFTAILPGADPAAGRRVAERLRQSVEQLRIWQDDQQVPVTISIGVASAPEDGTSLDDLLGAADRRLILAKQAGRNRIA